MKLSHLFDEGLLNREAFLHLTRHKPGIFSGLYMRRDGCPPHIFYNDAHAHQRQNSDITHECAHDILGHVPAEVFDGLGCRVWNAEQEAEVDYFAPALLVPADGALWALRSGLSDSEAAEHYRVSEKLFRMRAFRTGAKKRTGWTPG